MNRTLLKKVLLLVAIAISLTVKSQSVVKYERFVDDGHVWHNCIRAFEASDGNIIMMEECVDTITDYSGVYTESVNLLKISPEGTLIDSVKVDFTATSLDSPFLRVESETNNNVMCGFYLNENNELRYNAIFFDDNLSITNNIDIDFPVEGFTTSYKSIIDNDNNLILLSKKNGVEDTYIFVSMNVYGEIETLKYSVSDNYSNIYLTENPLYIHSNYPLEYGCCFLNGAGSTTITTIIYDENFEILNIVDINEFKENDKTYVFDCTESEMISLEDGNILMSSVTYEKEGFGDELSEYIQLTKFNEEYEVIDYVRVASRLKYGDEGQFYINTTKSILEDNNGNIYLIWINSDGEHTISFINNDMELIWDYPLNQANANISLLYDAFILGSNKLAVYGDYVNFEMGYFGFCYIVTNNSPLSFCENYNNIKPFSFYPNPASDFIKLSAISGQQSAVRVYNTLGMLVDEFEMNSNEIEINVSDYNSGMYFINISTDNGDTFTEKVMVR